MDIGINLKGFKISVFLSTIVLSTAMLSGCIGDTGGYVPPIVTEEAKPIDYLESRVISGAQIDSSALSDYRATVISGLPNGVYVSGKAQLPKPSGDGTYFQVVDAIALEQDQLTLNVPDGYIGSLDIIISLFYGADSEALEKQESTQSFYIDPSNDTLLFAQTGSVVIEERAEEVDEVEEYSNSSTPLDIIVNPLADETGLVRISGFDLNARLYDQDGYSITISDEGVVELPVTAVTGLDIDISEVTSDFMLDVALSTYLDGELMSASHKVFVPKVNFTDTETDETQLLVDGSREDYSVKRIANALVITEKDEPTNVVRVNMVQVPYIRFTDGFVSSSDFVNSIDVASIIGELDLSESLVLVSNVPADALVNNAIELGNGRFLLLASDIVDGYIDIDYSTVYEEFSADIIVEAYVGTEAQISFFNDQARATGYANAQAMADAGIDLSLMIGPDGVSAEARAYTSAGAVATAGGSVAVDGVGTASAEVSAEATIAAEIGAQLEVSDTSFEVDVEAGAEVTVSASTGISVEVEVIPGTNAETEGTVGVTVNANVNANNEVLFGDDQYGVGAEAGAEAGAMATATGYASGSVGGVGGNAEGGVSAGLGVAAGAGGVAKYDEGVITLGASGKLAFLIGVKLDVELVIDTNDVADTAKLVGDGVLTAVDAIESGLIPVKDAIEYGLITATDAVKEGLITATTAISEGLITATTAINEGLITVSDALEKKLIAASDAIADGLLTVEDAIQDGFITASEAIAGGFISANDAIKKGFISGADAVAQGFISAADAVKEGFIDAGDAVKDAAEDVIETIGGWLPW